MRPFQTPTLLYSGIKETVSSLLVQGDRIYIGTGTGSIYVHETTGTSIEVKKGLTRRAIEQLGYVKDINSLVILSDSQVILYHLPDYTPTILSKAKGAFSFAVNTSVIYLSHDGAEEPEERRTTSSIPTHVTQLAIGCRRKLMVFKWWDGEPQDPMETFLPHSPRAIQFFTHTTLCIAYSPSEFFVISLTQSPPVPVEIVTPLPTTTSNHLGALSGLTGYMSLGLAMGSKQPLPEMARLQEGSVMIVKDNQAFIVLPSAEATLADTFEWTAPPEDLAYIKPYVISVFPPGSISSPDLSTSAMMQIHSTISHSLGPDPLLQTTLSTSSPSNARFLTTSKNTVFYVTTPTSQSVSIAEGSTLWTMQMTAWAEQLDTMVLEGAYADALSLIDSESFDASVLPDMDHRRALLKTLSALALFSSGQYDSAMDQFIELNISPAKVIALYGENVSGRLRVEKSGWVELFGGPKPVEKPVSTVEVKHNRETAEIETGKDKPVGGSAFKMGLGLGSLMPGSSHGHGTDDERDTNSVHSVEQSQGQTGKKTKPKPDATQQSIESLLRYLSSLRPKLNSMLAASNILPSSQYPPLSITSSADLYNLPSTPLSSLTPSQQLLFAQIVDTALFKSYLVIRPGLLGSLCRIENWCQVEEVEEELRERGKIAEVIDLWKGKGMHKKALDLLRQIAEKGVVVAGEEEDRLRPIISYLQKLGPEHLPLIFEASRWIFSQDQKLAFEIFTSEDVELPRGQVADFLESISQAICARFLEFLIADRSETSISVHDRLVGLYLTMTLNAGKQKDEKLRIEYYDKFLRFIKTSNRYSVDRLYSLVSSEDLFEARAILLGRLGRHDQALEIYVYRLHDYLEAEEYCKQIYQPDAPTSKVFLTLLRIYLRPSAASKSSTADFLQPALDLISRHSPRLDTTETLNLLPPLITAQDVRAFLTEALKAPVFDTLVLKEIAKARKDQVSRTLMRMQMQRVKITDSRICPQCHKRIGGNSVIAVHAPRGEVTHFNCREPFAARLALRP